MKNRFKLLLCLSAIVSVMNIAEAGIIGDFNIEYPTGTSVTTDDLINVNTLTNNGSITNNGLLPDGGIDVKTLINSQTGTIDGTGQLKIGSGSNAGSIEQAIIEITSDFENSNTIIANTGFNNSGNITGAGSITINGSELSNNTNSGTISQNNITINGKINNNGNITSSESLNNAGEIRGTGNLIINEGENNGTIVQNKVTVNGTYSNNGEITSNREFTNSGNITGEGNLTLGSGSNEHSNSGTVSQKDITVSGNLNNTGTITSSGNFKANAVISGAGDLVINNGENTKGITQNNITISGNFTNSADMTVSEKLDNSGTITNSALITAIIDNTGTIKGNGDIVINGGSNTGTINQDEVTVAGTLANTGSITTNIFQNNSNITDADNTGSITVNKTGVNDGTITQNSIINNGQFTNNNTITASEITNKNQFVNNKDITANTVINDGTFINKGADASLTNANVTNNNQFQVIDNANITVNNITNKGTIQISNSSTLNISAQENNLGGTINVDNGNNTLSVSGSEIVSSINIGKNESTTLNFIQGTINETAQVNLAQNSLLQIAGGTVNLNQNDNWNGSITLNSGLLNIADITSNKQLIAEGGELTLVENKGVLNIGSDSIIKGEVTTTIEEGAELNIKGGNVVLNTGDTWKGTINLGTEGLKDDSSTLTVGLPTEEMGTLHADNGNLIVDNLNLTIGDGSYIKQEVAIQTSGNIKIIDGGYVAINDNDTLASGAKITLEEGGTLDYGKTEDASALVVGNAGNLNLLSGSVLTISNGSNIKDAVALDIQKGATLNLEENLTLNLDSKDKWNGHIHNKNGIINAKGVTDASGSLKQEDGELNLSEASKISLNSDSTITGGDIKIEDNSTLTIDNALLSGGDMIIDENSAFIVKSAKDAEFSLDSLTSSGLVNVMNSQLNRANIENLSIENQANFNIDILGRSSLRNDSDKFIIGNVAGDGTIRIDDWKLFGDVFGYDAPIDRHVKLGDIFIDKDGNPIEATIETTDKTNFSPIGWYQLNKGAGTNYTLDLVKFNPQVFRGQVATVSQWMNQLSIDDMLFTHSMVLPSFKEEDGGKMANHYASTDPLFAPYQYSRKDGGIWYKTYGTFEHLQMNNGLKHVGNNAYGTLIGADFGLKDLKNGWKFMPTAYVGYNGAHQYWSNVSQYQNGGQAGFLGTWYKDNFIVGAMAYGGVYGNTMDVYGHTDETFNYFAGTAAKASYNIRIHRDFVIQPNLMAAYNYFGQQNWHSNFGQMGMMSGMLHGVNIAPGINFIWEKDTFSAYLTLQYMYNVNGASGGRAGNVHLPQLEMERGYIQYGIGFTKKFTDRASGYFQAVLRNAGRTGVGLQAGFTYRLGK